MKKRALYITIAVSVVLTLILTSLGYKAVKITGEHPFCGSCHSWDGTIAEINVADKIHGASNPKGVQATCSQYHLPQTT